MEFQIFCNTDDEQLFANIQSNCKRDLEWVKQEPEHDGHAVLVGGGPSLKDNLDGIRWRQSLGQKVFALNNCASFLADHGIKADFQVIVDARPHNARFVGETQCYLASQCDPSVFDAAQSPILWHPVIEGIQDHVDSDREYALIGGGTSVGLSAMALAYALGYRKIHLFGYDSSHAESSHAYSQPENATEPIVKVTLGGKVYRTSLTMAYQAELIPELLNNLIDLGCVITYDGGGLMRAVFDEISRPSEPMAEVDKYEAMWAIDAYRYVSPGELAAQAFVKVAKPEGKVADIGCGTGRGALAIQKLTECELLLIDFTTNSRDEAAKALPFMQCDISKGIPVKVDYGYCADVMEHIPPELVDITIRNIMKAAPKTFFQISLVPDNMGVLIGQPLHISVHPFTWWVELFARLGFRVEWSEDQSESALFFITR